jgi:hypothetical protein
MHRCGSVFLLTLAITFVLTGCLGKGSGNSGNGAVTSVTLNPAATLSMNVGGTQVFSATGKNANGGVVLGVEIQFVVVSGTPNVSAPLSIGGNGNACAGTWDPTIAICSPGTPGIALVTAVIQGVSSPVTTVYVHQQIDSIQITQAESQPPQYDCFSQGQIWQYQGTAYSSGVDITSTVGPMAWSSSNTGVVTTSTAVPGLLPNQVQVTSKNPGVTQLFASVSGTTSAPYPYTSCLIQSIRLQIASQGQSGNTITIDNGTAVAITATAVDTLYGIANNTPLTSPPLTWSTTNPEVAAFSTITNTAGSNSATARNNLGGATLFASCAPPTCNIGVLPGLPIYASDGLLPNGTKGFGAIAVDVVLSPTAKLPTYTAWAATTDCQDQSGCSSALFSVTPGIVPIGAIIALPRTPNSMMFNHLSSARVYFGTDQGLMYVDVGATRPAAAEVSSSPTPCNVSLCGKVLTISNDGKLVVVSDTVSTPSQVYIYNSIGGAPVDLIIPGETATAAAFSPDQLKVFILTDTGNMYVYSTVDALTSVPVATSVTDVKFSADGSFAYVAGDSFSYPPPGPFVPATSISSFATCNAQPTVPNTLISPDSYFVTTPGIPLQIFPSPDALHVLALDPPYIDVFTTVDNQIALPDGQFVCSGQSPLMSILPNVNFPQTAQSANLGIGKFTPVYSQLVNDGTQLVVVAQNVPAVLLFDVSNGTTTSVPLSRPGYSTTAPLAATASTDGSQIYVAACDQYNGTSCAAGSVHIVCTSSCSKGQGDYQQVPYANLNQDNNPNMCNGLGAGAPLCLPNLIAIQPQ